MHKVTRTLAAKSAVASKTLIGTQIPILPQQNFPDPKLLGCRKNSGLDRALLCQLTEVRLAVEPAAARIAARQRTKHDLQVLRATLKRMYAAQGNQLRFSEADNRFHTALSVATHNPFFRSLLSTTEVILVKFLRTMAVETVADGKLHVRSAARHAKILDAIEAGDGFAAERAMILVIEDGLRDATEALLRPDTRQASKAERFKLVTPRGKARRI
jgi:DNA-binding FadR family transcriptional regulator